MPRTPVRSSRGSRIPQVPVPLGSLTQPGTRTGATCRACGSDRVMTIGMTLTDGSDVDFTSCRACEHRSWSSRHGDELAVDSVLDRARKQT